MTRVTLATGRPALLIAIWMIVAAAAAQASEFVAGFDDLPVMPGLAVVESAGIVFDTPGGRIVESYAAGPVSRDEVRRFYERTLPQLGWKRTDQTEYRREGEQLTIRFKGEDGALTVRFTLAPNETAGHSSR